MTGKTVPHRSALSRTQRLAEVESICVDRGPISLAAALHREGCILDGQMRLIEPPLREAAQMLSISVRDVNYLIATKRLSTGRIGTRVLISIEDIRKFARSDHLERLAG
jgi:excisionase family DNA binding protein